jgi:hypothetical protein
MVVGDVEAIGPGQLRAPAGRSHSLAKVPACGGPVKDPAERAMKMMTVPDFLKTSPLIRGSNVPDCSKHYY